MAAWVPSHATRRKRKTKARRSVSTPVSHLVFKPISVSSLVELVEDSVLRTLTDRKQNTQGMQPSKATALLPFDKFNLAHHVAVVGLSQGYRARSRAGTSGGREGSDVSKEGDIGKQEGFSVSEDEERGDSTMETVGPSAFDQKLFDLLEKWTRNNSSRRDDTPRRGGHEESMM
ncbi:MAG: hypothetical protein Q9175_002446 [Cornicularia normoerica]